MNRLPRARGRELKGYLAVAVVALFLAGCSGDAKPTPKASAGSTSSDSPGATSGAMRDQSAAVLGWTQPAPVARTQGFLIRRAPATAEVISVQAGEASTILTWQISAPTKITYAGMTLGAQGLKSWPHKVRLVDPVAQKSYSTNTMRVNRATDSETFCVCSAFPYYVGPVPVRMTAEFPALPAAVTSISLRILDFAPVTVPVTRY